ncbi:MAG: DNA-directed RNA polymerase subunit alpha C-terminal domain-containing protein [Planctomycetota bacterium]
MESTKRTTQDILSQTDILADDLIRLRRNIRTNPIDRKAVQSQLAAEEKKSKPTPTDNLRAAVLNWALSRTDRVVELTNAIKKPSALYIRASILTSRGDYASALALLREIDGKLESETHPSIEIIAALRGLGKLREAEALSSKLIAKFPNDADVLFEQAFNTEASGDYHAAARLLQKVLDIDPIHPHACFRLARYADLFGDNDQAIELYSRISGAGSTYVSAMINLGLLFEDVDDYNKALTCYVNALNVDPVNPRARLFKRNAEESLNMYYDETEHKESERIEVVLMTPISDFELSVRSRNCLSKMDIRSLGDLVKRSEQELLAYKNFGETSLQEIKEMLTTRNLRLGMATDQDAIQRRRDRLRLSGSDEATLNTSIDDLDLSVRSRKCVQLLGVETLGDLIERSEADLLATKNFGQTSLDEIKQKLGNFSLTLRPLHSKV